MIPEIALLLLITSAVFAAGQIWLGAYTAIYYPSTSLPLAHELPYPHVQQFDLRALRRISLLQTGCVIGSFILLCYLFLVNDFSVTYIVNHSHVDLPWYYRISAVWGAHEGSMLLWLLILGCWQAVVASSAGLESRQRAWMLSVLGVVSLGFTGFILLTSNPFARDFSMLESAGQDLNPLLQDPGLIVHPPILYAGYVGMALCYALAVGVLIQGKANRSDFVWLRKWLLLAWSFLTAGITLGSWWAYRVLGWGGWWFWDPVENASFLPWLAATALLHSLVIMRQNGAFLLWTVFLCIVAFSLSLLGTFLVRSGVLTSVHAFASDPSRGVYILGLFVVMLGGALALLIYRLGHWPQSHKDALFSKQFFLLLNSVLFFCLMLAILVGTLYPLIIETFTATKLSVGSPYFNMIFVPFALLILALMALVWIRKGSRVCDRYGVIPCFFVSLALAFIMLRTTAQPLLLTIALTLALWVFLVTSVTYYLQKQQKQSELSELSRPRLFSMTTLMSHLGVVIVALGVMLSASFSVQKDVKLAVGESMTIGPTIFKIVAMKGIHGPNYQAMQLELAITDADTGQWIATTYAEKRLYSAQNTVISHPGIVPGFWRDLYVAIGEPIPPNAWTLRLYYKPFVRWIWGGGLLIMLGGFFGFCQSLRRQPYQEQMA